MKKVTPEERAAAAEAKRLADREVLMGIIARKQTEIESLRAALVAQQEERP